MPKLIYAVTATLPDDATLAKYLAWLENGHITAVVAGGAETGEVIVHDRLDNSAPRNVTSRYVFPDRADFDRYERDHAPALRTEGRARFGKIEGVVFARVVGELRSSV